jgi:hypothetical protein
MIDPQLVETARARWGQTPIRTAVTISIIAWIVYAVTAGGSLATADAVAMLEQAKSIVDRGALDIPAEWSLDEWRGADGRYYSPFGIGQAVYDVPWLLAGRTIAKVGGRHLGDADAMSKALVAFGNSFVAAATVGFTFLLAWTISLNRRASAVAAFALAFGTLLWPYSKYGFNAPLVALGLTIGVFGFVRGAATRSTSALLLGAVGFSIALLTRHEMILASALGILWLADEARHARVEWKRFTIGAATIGAALVGWASLNYVRFGNPLRTGHRPGFSFAGVAGFTISPWGSLLLYSPITIAGLVIAWRHRRQPWSRLAFGIVVVLSVFYASLDDWLGTRSYGPRYLVPLLPLMIVPLARWRLCDHSRAVTLAVAMVLAVSVVVQLPPVLVEISHARIASGKPSRPEHVLEWASSPLIVTTRRAIAAVPENIAYLSGETPPSTLRATEPSLGERVAFSLDFWWLYLVYLRAISLRVAMLVILAMTIVAIVLARRLGTDLGSDPNLPWGQTPGFDPHP